MPHGPELHEDLSALPRLLEGLGPPLLVRDPLAWEASGAAAALEPALRELGAVAFEGQGDSPTLEQMQRAASLAEAEGCRVIVAVGGGTSIDTAKGAAWCLAGGAIDRAPRAPLLTLVAVPTTAGTGSEATHFAVCWHEGVKHSLADERLRPKHAIVDSNLHLSLPPRLTATTGLDALCQSLESLWAHSSNEASRADGARAAQLILGALETAVTQPSPESRRQMARGAHLAGRAIDVSKTTTPHALSYALTHDHGVPHGFAVALTFGACLQLRHERAEGPAGTEEVTALLGGTPEAALANFRALLTSCGAPTRLQEVGIKEGDLEALAAAVNSERLANDTLAPTPEELRRILWMSWV